MKHYTSVYTCYLALLEQHTHSVNANMHVFVCMEYANLLHLPKCAKHNAWTVSQSPSRLNANWWGCVTTMLEMLLLAWCMLTFYLLRKWTPHTRFPFQTEPFVLKRISCCFLAGQVPCQSYLSNKYPFKGRPGYRVDLPVMVGSLG